LPVANCVYDINAGHRTARRHKGLEPQHWLSHPCHGPIILLNPLAERPARMDPDGCAVAPADRYEGQGAVAAGVATHELRMNAVKAKDAREQTGVQGNRPKL
jgi:hypothetical protein